MRLLHWMDTSKGRVRFGQTFPGHAPKGFSSTLRLMPDLEKLPEDLVENLPAEITSRSQSGPTATPASVPRRRAASVSGVPLQAAKPQLRRQSTKGLTSAACVSSTPSVPLPDWVRVEIQKTFSHYTSLGDPLNRSTLSSQKFNRFLRDCGLLSMEAQGAVSFDFAPEGRRMSLQSPSGSRRQSSTGNLHDLSVPDLSSPATRQGSMSRSSSTGSVAGRRPSQGGGSMRSGPRGSLGSGFVSSPDAARRASFSVSLTPASQSELPLKVFLVPPLTSVEADLVFVQAISSDAGDKVKAAGNQKGKRFLTAETFSKALVDVARRCMPPEDVSTGLDDFCQKVIVPLNELLLSSRSEDMSRALDVMKQPSIITLLNSCAAGLEKLFLYYATGPSKKQYWSPEAIVKFASDFDLMSEVSNLPLQRIFQDVCQHEREQAGMTEGEMGFEGFKIALVMLSQKTHVAQPYGSSAERVPLFFQRLNAIASTQSFSRLNLMQEQLLPLPKETSSARPRKNSRGSISAVPGRDRCSVDADLSWTEIMTGAQSF
eukprot:TRINITY_DN78002_c0_g1_i1.p1 TRINITY_DN78002_c0_g1~~TRINITY_DN78002_c0_g1_i1.p1  ORF type:complete len:543 (+),score=76.78 TRINITY_DN78002_c0_g1_i1:906-2534(+)